MGPGPKHSDNSNVSLSPSLWLLWQLFFPCRPCMCRYGCRGGHTGLLPWAVTGMENYSLQYPAVSAWIRKHSEHSNVENPQSCLGGPDARTTGVPDAPEPECQGLQHEHIFSKVNSDQHP